MSDLILPEEQKPNKQPALTIPILQEFKGQAVQILKGMGLSFVKQKLITINSSKVADEATANNPDAGNIGYDKMGVFGMPLWDTVTLKGLSYENFEGQSVNLKDFTLDIALIDTYRDRHIPITPITGRDGDVKEMMSNGDWIITINGSLINPLSNTPPEQLVRALNAFCTSEVEIEVNSTVLSYLDIFSIVIMKPRFIQRIGARNVIDYELECRSERPFELKS